MSSSHDGRLGGFLFGPPDDGNEGSTDKGKSRQRATMACVHCRRRKIRCDGQEPACGTCQRLNKPCEYEAISEEENVIAREKKRASRIRKAQLAGLASFSATNSPLGIAGSSSSRFVVPSPGTPYGAVVSPDAYSSNKRFFSDHSFDTGPGALRRRGATVSGPTDLMRSTSTSPYSTMGGLQMGGITRQAMPGAGPSAGEETDVVSSDLPPWARTTIPPQGLAWSPDQTWQGHSTNQAVAHHSNAGLRRRSSVDNMPYIGKGSWTSSQDTVAAAASAAAAFAAAQRPAAALAPRVGHEPPAWLTNRSVSHQELSRDQLLNWSNYFGDRTLTPLQQSHRQSAQLFPILRRTPKGKAKAAQRIAG
ncbi:hypothetical protein BDZ90DRAFT_273434 [Jaminaea rosea]|uniref:Zn(2)-C6 fungal-type domain-containing protein n=1 Tax=Jaminaea rosea TaxID=1569628 RepID=A0A316UWU3_9BASI|nr:hypothetical protein BDZ90DRAFT_273434 [Jaminaea rosea]PWN29444.1 hypothetical protein BDZ90DRAFT_273434 [Jaminaea rosea]